MRRLFFLAGGMVAGLALCLALALHVGLRTQNWEALAGRLSLPWVACVLLLTVLYWWCGARKWAALSLALHGPSGREPSRWFFFRHIAFQHWAGQFVPPSLAIVFGRGWAARRMPGVGTTAGFGNALYDQALEFILLAGLLPASWLGIAYLASWQACAAGALLGVFCAMGAVMAARQRFAQGERIVTSATLGWSAARVFIMLLRLMAGASALGLSIPSVAIALAAPAVALLALVPLTPGNLGLAEWGWTGVLIRLGVPTVQASLYALGFRLLLFAAQSVLLAAVAVAWQAYAAHMSRRRHG